jgi:hypothetical protein
MGRCEPTTGIEPFGRLVHQVLAQEPYRSGKRLFWIVDNGSSHRGETAQQRLHQVDSRIILVHTSFPSRYVCRAALTSCPIASRTSSLVSPRISSTDVTDVICEVIA